MKLTIKIDDKLAQENVKKLWMNRIDVTKVVNEMLASLKFEFKYDFKSVTIQETTSTCNGLKQPRNSRQLDANCIQFEPSSFS